jgi:hypothetical protein
MLNPDPNRRFNRAVILLLGTTAVGLGLAPVLYGRWFYLNWWGGPVFGPISIIFGLVLIFGALFKPKIF